MVNYKNPQVVADMSELIQQDLKWNNLKNKTVMVTGATGMLASYIGFFLLYLNNALNINIKPVFLARNVHKLKKVYGKYLDNVDLLIQDVCDPIKYNERIDYIFHAAGGASPACILSDPVGVVKANVQGIQQVLDLARSSETEKVVFTSTREIYGKVEERDLIREEDMGVLDPLDPRNCYPESKRLAEVMLLAYHKQYGINFNTIRIAHSYGPGMQLEGDGRVMADLINDAINGRDIILKSTGEAERAFCYVGDAVSGIFRVALEGKPCTAYNLANEKEPVRIIDLANMLQRIVDKGKGIIIETGSNQAGYTNYMRKAMDTTRIERLGWYPKVGLEEGLGRTLRSFMSENSES